MNKPAFHAIGECMVEMAPQGAEGQYRRGFAGDTFNTAWYVRQLGQGGIGVSYLTAVGQDRMSAEMLHFIAASGIDTAHIAQLADRTVGLYTIHLDAGERSFSYWRGQSAARLLARHLPEASVFARTGDVIHFSGITLAILSDPDRMVLLDFLRDARAAGAVISFDPNIRPALWARADGISGWLRQAAALCDLAFPSFDEEARIDGSADTAAVAERYLRWGAGTVIVKNGAAPGLLVGQDQNPIVFHPEAAPLLVDTTAAGDSFNAGFLVAYMQGAPLEACAAAGARLAARVIGKFGALVEL